MFQDLHIHPLLCLKKEKSVTFCSSCGSHGLDTDALVCAVCMWTRSVGMKIQNGLVKVWRWKCLLSPISLTFMLYWNVIIVSAWCSFSLSVFNKALKSFSTIYRHYVRSDEWFGTQLLGFSCWTSRQCPDDWNDEWSRGELHRRQEKSSSTWEFCMASSWWCWVMKSLCREREAGGTGGSRTSQWRAKEGSCPPQTGTGSGAWAEGGRGQSLSSGPCSICCVCRDWRIRSPSSAPLRSQVQLGREGCSRCHRRLCCRAWWGELPHAPGGMVGTTWW